jgi:hypothetical protein
MNLFGRLELVKLRPLSKLVKFTIGFDHTYKKLDKMQQIVE